MITYEIVISLAVSTDLAVDDLTEGIRLELLHYLSLMNSDVAAVDVVTPIVVKAGQ